MNRPLICMTLTCDSLAENVELVKKYEKEIDLVELRVDFLNEDEQLFVRKFPSMINLPCILTIRRDVDGGLFSGGEFSRTSLFARALAFANQDTAKNFAYVDFEDDFNIPSIQDAALAFGTRIIRSHHNMSEPVYDIVEKCNSMRKTGFEIPKIAFMPKQLSDVTRLFQEGKKVQGDHILCAMGPEGMPSRILSTFSNSYLTYISPKETMQNVKEVRQLTPYEVNELYRFKSISENTKLFGLLGWPLVKTDSPVIHNFGYRKFGMDACYFPIRTPIVSDALHFADYLDITGMSVTIPHKESVLYYLHEQSSEVVNIGACNTIVKRNNKWIGYNTDAYGFKRSLEEFIGDFKIKRKKVSVIGAGGAAKAIAYVLKQMGAKVCIFNRTVETAKNLAEKYGFQYCQLSQEAAPVIDEYSSLIIQTTSVGMNSSGMSDETNDPIWFYNFHGNELLFDIVYNPAITPIMRRASLAGCRVLNGYKMLEYQAYMQFKLFTGKDYESE